MNTQINKSLTGNGNFEVMADDKGELIRGTSKFKIQGVDGMVVGDTDLFTTVTNRGNFIMTAYYFLGKNITGVIGTPPVVGMGFTGPTYNDLLIFSGLGIIADNEVNNNLNLNMLSTVTIPPSTPVKVRVDTAGILFATYEFDVYVEGFYELS